MSDGVDMQYIMDGNGNYYRVNGNNQLVVAESKEEATVFDSSDANQRIGDGKKAKFYQAIPVDEKIIAITNTAEQEPKKPINMEYDISAIDWPDYMNLFCYLSETAKNYQEELNAKVSVVDKEICDLLHYVELYDLSDEESVDAVEMLKDARQRRRDIKDEQTMLEAFMRSVGTSANVAKAKNCVKEMGKLETRKYTPRELSELFVGMEKRKTNREICREQKEKSSVPVISEQAEVKMEKQETIYDGKENDWLGFAKSQRDFFTNVQQYMFNLECELDDIEYAIEDLLRTVEDANYNVAQGYKVFKELKDLRNERMRTIRKLNP
ncbi:MAG: hypothetical protein UHS49_02095 [Faecalimonas sp.]|nr:hypothetical protein [Faecalimonas sp.]